MPRLPFFPGKQILPTLVHGVRLQEVLGTLKPAQVGTGASLVLGGILRNTEFWEPEGRFEPQALEHKR